MLFTILAINQMDSSHSSFTGATGGRDNRDNDIGEFLELTVNRAINTAGDASRLAVNADEKAKKAIVLAHHAMTTTQDTQEMQRYQQLSADAVLKRLDDLEFSGQRTAKLADLLLGNFGRQKDGHMAAIAKLLLQMQQQQEQM